MKLCENTVKMCAWIPQFRPCGSTQGVRSRDRSFCQPPADADFPSATLITFLVHPFACVPIQIWISIWVSQIIRDIIRDIYWHSDVRTNNIASLGFIVMGTELLTPYVFHTVYTFLISQEWKTDQIKKVQISPTQKRIKNDIIAINKSIIFHFGDSSICLCFSVLRIFLSQSKCNTNAIHVISSQLCDPVPVPHFKTRPKPWSNCWSS